MPREWERRPVTVPSAASAEIWHGVLHVYDQHRFRRITPFPPKRRGTFRVMAVGDSMTYGDGVDEQSTYVSRLQSVLGKQFDIEILNLGRDGWQSEDILGEIRRWLPELRPDLVTYGANHNDFLPSGIGQYAHEFAFPLPEGARRFFLDRTRFARLLEGGYDATLRMLHLRTDFFNDILRDLDGYQRRFRRDVAEMNREVTALGLPPIVAMMLDQFPTYDGRGHRITKIAEDAMREAGMNVIELEDYYRRFDGRVMSVSLWEGHANEEAHAIFAAMFAARLARHPALEPYRRGAPTAR
jgi:hypothetical protein